jgi:hypothetical protein
MANFFADLFTGGAASRNEQARKARDTDQKNIDKIHDYNWSETKRKYDHAVEGLEITKRNTEKNLQFQEAEREQKYDYGMGIRAYEYSQNVRAYDAQVSRAVRQQTFNELAEGAALVDQDRFIHEQLLSISFDETESLLEYGAAAAGLGLKKRQALGAAATQAQATRISALKATGAALARGMAGRSAAGDIQGMVAEAGARQGAIIDELMFNLEGTDMDFLRLNNQFVVDQVAFETSRESAKMTDITARAKIKQQAIQSAIDAAASIGLKPEIAPPLPKPFALPRPEFQDIYVPKEPPKTMLPPAAQENLFVATLNQFSQNASLLTGGFGLGGGGGGGGSGFAPGVDVPVSQMPAGMAFTGQESAAALRGWPTSRPR